MPFITGNPFANDTSIFTGAIASTQGTTSAPNSNVQDLTDTIPPIPPATQPATGTNSGATPSISTTSTNTVAPDQRVRLSPLPSAESQVYGQLTSDNILFPLYATNGLMFPYSPQVTFTQDVNYQDVELVHTNADYEAYRRTPSVSLTINGKFVIQTKSEGLYCLACLHFLRVVSKMYFGDNYDGAANPYIGLPPPILLLNGYGQYMFNNLRVILKSHTFTYDQQMDLVKIDVASGSVWLPTMFEVGITVKVQQTPNMQRTQFDLGKFRTGALMRTGGWI